MADQHRDTNALKFVFVTKKRVSVTSVTASLGHSAANAGDVSWFGCGVGRAVSYRVGDRYYCTIDNVDPGARFARAEGTTREEAESTALEKAARYLEQTRRFPTA